MYVFILFLKRVRSLYENPNFDIATFYGVTAARLMIVIFYFPCLPMISLVAFFGGIFALWIEKVL